MPNVELPTSFPEQLRARRLARRLTEAELADRAGLTYKTVRSLETGRRHRVMERTVMSLAVALECTVEELLAPPAEGPESEATADASTLAPTASDRPSRRRGVVATLSIVASLSIAIALFFQVRAQAELRIDQDRVVAHDPIFGLDVWERDFPEGVIAVGISPWDRTHALIGTGSTTPDGGHLHLVERSSGRTIWSRGVDLDAVTAAFGSEIVDAASFSVLEWAPGSFGGDGRLDLAVRFVHGLYYPTVIARIDRDGALRGHYAHRGHLHPMLLYDLDDDGRLEVIAAGTNNDRELGGATVVLLDADHWEGASRDRAPLDGDGCRARVVLPNFPEEHMREMGRQRLQVDRVSALRTSSGEARFNVEIGAGGGLQVVVVLDASLQPLAVRPKDSLIAWIHSDWPEELRGENGPAGQAWLDTWLTGARRNGRPALVGGR